MVKSSYRRFVFGGTRSSTEFLVPTTKERRCSLGRAINLDAAERNTARRDASTKAKFSQWSALGGHENWDGRSIWCGKGDNNVRNVAQRDAARCYVAGSQPASHHPGRSPSKAEAKAEAGRQRASAKRERADHGVLGCVWNVSDPIGHARCVDRTE